MSDYENLLLAAVVHDVGKFWQGMGEKGRHQELGAKFVRLHFPEKWQGAAGLVAMHHAPEKLASEEYERLKILMISDWLSSGERQEREEDKTGKRINAPLISIFSEIDTGKGVPEEKWYVPVKKLALEEESLFPKPLRNNKKDLTADYKKLWNKFVCEVDKIKNISDFSVYFNTLYHILQKYTWCVPSAVYKDVPDISLFDHLKSSCAIASCLFNTADEEYLNNVLKALHRRWKIKNELKRKRINDDELDNQLDTDFDKEASIEERESLKNEKFILIGGDISGIQKFIYTITSKGAAKGLRGRSFYLQLLSEVLANYILRELKLQTANLLYCSGGHFYILAPYSAHKKLEDLRKKITEKLLKHHSGDVLLILDWINLSGLDFLGTRFGKKWDEIALKLAERKKKKFIDILDKDHHRDIFGPFPESRDICEACGSDREVHEDENGKKKCVLCKSFEELSEKIARAKYIVEIVEEKKSAPQKGWEEVISDFCVRYDFEIKDNIRKIDAESITIHKLNDTDFLENASTATEIASCISSGFKFLANKTPMENGNIKSFDDFAEKAEGIKKWAVLRMDVDNLGKIFSEGLGQNRTVSRISTLSSMLSLYFTGWMEKICESYENIYAIYSGGDDAFIVGQWDDIPELAYNINSDFRKFTCHNDNITLSGGIFIAPDRKYPLYKAAYSAGEALDKSKHAYEDKDAVTFLYGTVKWKDFEEIIVMKNHIVNALEKNVSRALIYRLAEAFVDCRLYKEQKIPLFRVWRLIYNLNSLSRRHKEAEHELKNIENSFIANHFLKPYVNVPIRWAEYLTRKEG